jgi:hypothetical protein
VAGQAVGGSGGADGGTGAYAGATHIAECTECLQDFCAAPFDACASDPSCAAIFECANGCLTDGCHSACALGFPSDSVQKMSLLQDCGGAECAFVTEELLCP